MTQYQSFELSAVFGLSMGFLIAIIWWDIKFTIEAIKDRRERKKKEVDADVE